MPDVPQLAKAELRELDASFKNEINRDKWTKVQFNPDTLKVTFANQIQQPSGSGDQRGSQAQQFVGAGTTKLAVQLWFDVTQDLGQGLPDVIDVRQLTQRVAYFITPIGQPKNDPKKYLPPGVRLMWGTFQFDGIVESMEENLELFSFEGRPLRASVALAIAQQKITTFAFNQANEPPSFTRRNRPTIARTRAVDRHERDHAAHRRRVRRSDADHRQRHDPRAESGAVALRGRGQIRRRREGLRVLARSRAKDRADIETEA